MGELSLSNKEIIIKKVIHQFGVPPALRGYQYIVSAELMALDDSYILQRLIDVAYPQIAYTHYTTPKRVEKAIQHAIEIAWPARDKKAINHYSSNRVPTNKEFLVLLYKQIIFLLKATPTTV